MPELPEVEVIARRLREGSRTEPKIVGARVERARLLSEKILKEPTRAAFLEQIAGARVLDVKRRAKHLLVVMDRGVLLLHLRMTGDLHVVARDKTGAREPRDEPRFVRLALDLELDSELEGGGHVLAFTDSRHLGTARFVDVDGAAKLLADLGPEPLQDGFTVDALADILRHDQRAVKAVLLDQSSVAGLGNIYSDEACFLARVHPAAVSSSLSPAEVARLHGAVRAALQSSLDAILADDADIHWRYANKQAPNPFLVYDRAGQPCPRCGTRLVSSRVAGRTSVACSACQPARRQRSKKTGRKPEGARD